MKFAVLFTVCRRLMPAGSLILAFGFTSTAIAQNTFSGALPSEGLGLDNSAPFLPKEKNELTLRDAALLALDRNPELAAFAKEKLALEGATLQAGLLPNPELSTNVENIGNVQPLQAISIL